MITFKQYLEEARMAPLYHGTHLDAAVDILNSGYLIPTKSHHQFQLLMQKPGTGSSRVNGISMSRDFNTSAKWNTDTSIIAKFKEKFNLNDHI